MTTAPDTPAPPSRSPGPMRRALGGIHPALLELRTFLTRWLRRASTLSPHTLLFGAVFQKEMQVAGRKNSTFLVRSIYGVLLIALALLVFLASRAGSRTQTGAAGLQRLQDIAPAVTQAVLWFQMIFLPLVAATLAAPSICDEVRARSLPALLTTPLTSAQIIGSKLSSCLANVTILALLSVPLLLGLRLFGGVDPRVILAGSAITISAAILAGSMGMLVSIFARRSSLAGSAAIGGVIGLMLVPILLLFLLHARGLLTQNQVIELMGGLCSPATLGMILSIAAGDAPPGVDFSRLWISNTIYNLIASGILLALATLAFRARLTGDRGEGVTGAADRPSVLNRRKRSKRRDGSAAAPTPDGSGPSAVPPDASGFDPARAGSLPAHLAVRLDAPVTSRTVGDHPVLWRELRRQGSRAPSRRTGLSGAVFTLALLAILGVFLPLYGLWDAANGSTRSVGYIERSEATPLLLATGAYVLFVTVLIILTTWRAIKRLGLGDAVVIPPRAVLLFCLAVGPLLFSYWESDGDLDGIHYVVAAIGQVLILLRAATQNAGTLAEEREARTWETLLTSRLSPWEILSGKLVGALARQWDLPALVLLHFAFAGVLLSHLSPLILLHLGATMLGGVCFLSGTGMLFALLAPKGSVASLLNTGLALTVWLVLPMGIGLTTQALALEWDLNEAIGTVVLGSNPIALGMFALEGAIDAANYAGRGSMYSIAAADFSPLGFTLTVVGVGFIYGVLGLLAFVCAGAQFNRRTGRTS